MFSSYRCNSAIIGGKDSEIRLSQLAHVFLVWGPLLEDIVLFGICHHFWQWCFICVYQSNVGNLLSNTESLTFAHRLFSTSYLCLPCKNGWGGLIYIGVEIQGVGSWPIFCSYSFFGGSLVSTNYIVPPPSFYKTHDLTPLQNTSSYPPTCGKSQNTCGKSQKKMDKKIGYYK